MLDTENKRRKEQQKQKVKKRYSVTIDPENYLFIPAKKQAGYYDNDVNQRVATYVRVSTDDVRQTTSYELLLIEYNGKKKNPAQRLSMNKLHARESSIFSGLEDSTAPDEEWAGDSETEEDSVF